MHVWVCIRRYVCVYLHTYVCIWVCICVSVLGVCVNCLYLYVVAWYSDLDSLVRSELGNRRFGLMPVWTRCLGYSKIDPCDDLEIHTSSCCEDQTAIRSQSHAISYECSFFYYFLIYHCQYYLYHSCDHLLYFTSMITFITSWDVSECTLQLYSLFECYQFISCDGWLPLLIQD